MRLQDAQRSLLQNIAGISGDFHTHELYGAFYDTHGKFMDGFVGNFDICIEMAEALTDWEIENNGTAGAYEEAGVPWIEVVAAFVSAMLERMTETGDRINPRSCLRELAILQGGDA